MNWIGQSFISMISITLLVILFKKITLFKIESEVINFYFFFGTTMLFGIFTLLKKSNFAIPSASIPYFISAAIIAILYNYFSISAIKSAPNPGYVEAIVSFRVVIILIASTILFNSGITPIKFIGICLCTAGLILINF